MMGVKVTVVREKSNMILTHCEVFWTIANYSAVSISMFVHFNGASGEPHGMSGLRHPFGNERLHYVTHESEVRQSQFCFVLTICCLC